MKPKSKQLPEPATEKELAALNEVAEEPALSNMDPRNPRLWLGADDDDWADWEAAARSVD